MREKQYNYLGEGNKMKVLVVLLLLVSCCYGILVLMRDKQVGTGTKVSVSKKLDNQWLAQYLILTADTMGVLDHHWRDRDIPM